MSAQHSNITHLPGESSPLPARAIQNLVRGPDAELGHFLAEGGETARRGAFRSALVDAQALCEVLTSIDKDQALDAVDPVQSSRFAWIAGNFTDRAMELQSHGEGNSDERTELRQPLPTEGAHLR